MWAQRGGKKQKNMGEPRQEIQNKEKKIKGKKYLTRTINLLLL